MKKVLTIAAITLIVASLAVPVMAGSGGGGGGNGNGQNGERQSSGWAGSVISQSQAQDFGGFATPTGGAAGGSQTQEQGGVGAAVFGSTSSRVEQGQGFAGGVTSGLVDGDGFRTRWDMDQHQIGWGEAGCFSGYGYTQNQNQVGVSFGLTDGGGTYSVAGSVYRGSGELELGAVGRRGDVGAGQGQDFSSEYQVRNTGDNGVIDQYGSQSVSMGMGAADGGQVSVGVVQVGGTYAQNDGQATSMEGGGMAFSSGSVRTDGNAAGEFSADQTHTYSQSVEAGGAYQYSSGTVTTSIGPQGNGGKK